MYTLTAITANRLEVDLQAPREIALRGRAPPHCIWFPCPERFKIKTRTHALSLLRRSQLSAYLCLSKKVSGHEKATNSKENKLHVHCRVWNGFLNYHFSWLGHVAEGIGKPISDIPGSCFCLVILLPAGVWKQSIIFVLLASAHRFLNDFHCPSK